MPVNSRGERTKTHKEKNKKPTTKKDKKKSKKKGY